MNTINTPDYLVNDIIQMIAFYIIYVMLFSWYLEPSGQGCNSTITRCYPRLWNTIWHNKECRNFVWHKLWREWITSITCVWVCMYICLCITMTPNECLNLSFRLTPFGLFTIGFASDNWFHALLLDCQEWPVIWLNGGVKPSTFSFFDCDLF